MPTDYRSPSTTADPLGPLTVCRLQTPAPGSDQWHGNHPPGGATGDWVAPPAAGTNQSFSDGHAEWIAIERVETMHDGPYFLSGDWGWYERR